ncbi:pilus assembly protein [Octadecabacter sp. G9-8]|uniref:Pilus assembly protein n=1 Tax=Octadecabacter dasysiphoniae TaxID=2909341 RepID=A0ABS9CXE5_9RHOB|nr:pilus assembly protein [Octadecabacter dasysiphoniae]MCF2871913.1 pilus assembly protein [Octadecabacter dasysiphoniae]
MMFGIKTIGKFLRLFRRKEDGGPSIEFVLVFMPFMVITVSGFELGLLMTRHVMMERGVDIAVRDVRLNTGVPIDETEFKRMVCNGAGLLGDDCMTKVRLEMVSVNMWDQSSVGASAMPREASCTDVAQPFLPARNFVNGTPNEMMIVRACGLFTPMLPEFALGYFLSRMRTDGFYPLVSTTAFVMEPV